MRKKHFLKLRAAVVGSGYNLLDLAAHLQLTPQGLNAKLQGKNQFTLAEMIKACNFLDSPVDIFFDPELHNLQFIELHKAQ